MYCTYSDEREGKMGYQGFTESVLYFYLAVASASHTQCHAIARLITARDASRFEASKFASYRAKPVVLAKARGAHREYTSTESKI